MTKVVFQVLCFQVGGGRKIAEVQVRVCYYWQRLFSFTLSSSQVCVGECCVLKLCKDFVPCLLNFFALIQRPCVLIGSE